MRRKLYGVLTFGVFGAIGIWATSFVFVCSTSEAQSLSNITIQRHKVTPLPSSTVLRKRAPLRSPSGVWTWFDIPKTKCGYGTTTGMALNPSPKEQSKTLLIFLQGGGACWKEKGLFGGCFSYPRSAFSLKGINKKTFRRSWRIKRITRSFVVQRRSKVNPLRDAHYAFLPYCTGDLHAGNTSVTFRKGRTIHFHGHKNMQEFLKRLVPTFKHVNRIILAGVSAGGVGASLHWQRVKRAFGSHVRVDLLNDGGAPMNPIAKRWKRWNALWDLQLPKGCTTCKQGIRQLLAFYQKTMMKQGRMAFLGHTEDRIVRSFMGLGMFGKRYPRHLKRALKRLDKESQAQYFVLPGSSHVMLFRRNAAYLKGQNGQTLSQWLTHFIRLRPTWASTHPFPRSLRVTHHASPLAPSQSPKGKVN